MTIARPAAALLVAAALSTPALAGAVTEIRPGAPGEPGLDAILNTMLGQSLSLAEYNVAGGGVEAPGVHAGRVADAQDHVFYDGVVSVTFTALFWGGNSIDDPIGNATHSFGYTLDNGAKQTVFSSGDADLNDSVVISPVIGQGEIRWFAQRGGKHAWSDPSMNSALGATGSTDRMIAFNLDGLETLNLLGANRPMPIDRAPGDRFSYILAFDTGNDADYNDLIVLVQGVTNAIPLPSAATMGLIGVAGAAQRRRR